MNFFLCVDKHLFGLDGMGHQSEAPSASGETAQLPERHPAVPPASCGSATKTVAILSLAVRIGVGETLLLRHLLPSGNIQELGAKLSAYLSRILSHNLSS